MTGEPAEGTTFDHTIADDTTQEVTLRGDLEQIDLSDIFQTLAMSKMEGVLRLGNALEQRLISFRDGFVKILPHGRAEAQRIGSCLLHGGLLNEQQLRDALQRQRDQGVPLGQILVDEGLVTQDEIVQALAYQSAEDLYSLFTWRSGNFEFYKGPPSAPDILAKIDLAPAFETSSVLLEVARRADEWDLILRALHSVDEVLVPSFEVHHGDGLPDDHGRVMRQVDGTRSIREVSDATMLGLFDCARAARDLLEQGFVELAPVQEMLRAAEAQRARGDARRALVTLRTLVDRDQPMSLQETRELAVALERCGDPRSASRCLCQAARETHDPGEALELAREAARLDKRSSAVLEYLRELLEEAGAEGPELIDTTAALADALVQEGRAEAALAELDRLEELGSDPLVLLSRRARLLQRLGRTADAIAVLLEVAKLLRPTRRRTELVRVYEQILKLDPEQREIAQALQSLRRKTSAGRARTAVALSLLLAVAGGGVVVYEHKTTAERVRRTVAGVRARIGTEEASVLRAEVAAATAELGHREELEALAAEIMRVEQRRLEKERRERREILRKELAEAADLLEQGDLAGALDLYAELRETSGFRSEVDEVLENRLAALVPHMQRLAATLPALIPGPPVPTQSETDRRELLARLGENFKPSDRQRARGIVQAVGHPVLVGELGKEAATQLRTDAAKVYAAFETARERIDAYRRSLLRSATQRQLEPVFLRAQEHERALRFEEAVADYRRLLEEYPAEDAIKDEFRRRLRRYESVLAVLEEMRAATEAGDHAAALAGLRGLQRAEPDIPFGKLVELPLEVATVPEGAEVWLDGRRVGETPLATTYRAAGRTRVEVRLPGFRPEKAVITDGEVGSLAFLMAKVPQWQSRVEGSVQRQPAADDGGMLFVTDRSGTVSALDGDDGSLAWSRSVDDLNGLLPSAALTEHGVVVASFDGPVRCFTREDGGLRWEADGASCEAAPLAVGSLVVLATEDGHALALDAATGERRWRLRLPGPVHADPVAERDRVFVVTEDGWVVALDARVGREVWRRNVAPRIAATPCRAGGSLYVASDDGRLFCLRATDGAPLWERDAGTEVTRELAVTDRRVLVVSGRVLRSFGLDDGAPGPELEAKDVWSSPPAVVGGDVVAGVRGGEVLALDPDTLEPRYRVRGDGTLTAQPLSDASGRLVLAFESGAVHALPLSP